MLNTTKPLKLKTMKSFNWMLHLVSEMGSTIEIDEHCYCTKGDTYVRIWGKVNGKTKSITYATREELAQLYKKHGKIERYDGTGNEVTMYTKEIVVQGGGQQGKAFVPFEWSDVQFSPLMVKRLLVIEEFKIVNTLCNALEGIEKSVEHIAMNFLACLLSI
jgi:hypothetical protein